MAGDGRAETIEGLVVRPAERADVPALYRLVRGLAEYERLLDTVVGDERQLEAGLFERKAAEALIAEIDSEPAGYALFFTTFSSFLGMPGLWIEDLFVEPERRRRGIGRSLFAQLARIATQRGYGRLEWAVLDWNGPALRFYEGFGARPLDEWRSLRIEGEELRRLAVEAGS